MTARTVWLTRHKVLELGRCWGVHQLELLEVLSAPTTKKLPISLEDQIVAQAAEQRAALDFSRVCVQSGEGPEVVLNALLTATTSMVGGLRGRAALAVLAGSAALEAGVLFRFAAAFARAIPAWQHGASSSSAS